MGPQTRKLSTRLSQIEDLLVRQNEQDWAARILKSNTEIQNQDFHGVERFLGLLGGMGSLNDLVFPDSHATEELRSLLSDAYEVAMSIKRQQ